jgi:peptidyl-Lys metalloendopeptidase
LDLMEIDQARQVGIMNAEELSIKLELDRARYKALDRQMLRFTLTNKSKKALNVLKWHTPFDGVKSNMFQVEAPGQRALYLGRVIKRGIPTPKDYITLEPNESATSELDLAEAYDISSAGKYGVSFTPHPMDAGMEEPETLAKKYLKKTEALPRIIASNVATFELVESRKPKLLKGVALDRVSMLKKTAEKVPTFKNCAGNQQDTLNEALAEAVKIAEKSRSAVSSIQEALRPTATRYKTWFGAYEKQRYEKVINNYDKIWDALANKNVTFNCDCKEDAFAYVYPSKPYEIYLCDAFWTAPLNGTDSKAGTIVHECSHFYVVASTDDWVYGQAKCKNLAISEPDKSIDNADCHEYFAENTPPLDMGDVAGTSFQISAGWKNLPAIFKTGLQAALNGNGPSGGKCFFFKGFNYIRYDWNLDKADSGFPRKISDDWRDLPKGYKGNFNAALSGRGPLAGKCFFFRGDSYIAYDWIQGRADPGYPRKIADGWNGLTEGFQTDLDAALNGSGPLAGKCFFFKGDSYIAYDWTQGRADPGYPRKITDGWHGLPAGFEGKFDAAVEGAGKFGGKGYFFKKASYVRYDWQAESADF